MRNSNSRSYSGWKGISRSGQSWGPVASHAPLLWTTDAASLFSLPAHISHAALLLGFWGLLSFGSPLGLLWISSGPAGIFSLCVHFLRSVSVTAVQANCWSPTGHLQDPRTVIVWLPSCPMLTIVCWFASGFCWLITDYWTWTAWTGLTSWPLQGFILLIFWNSKGRAWMGWFFDLTWISPLWRIRYAQPFKHLICKWSWY